MAYRHFNTITVFGGFNILLQLGIPSLVNDKKAEAEKQAIAERLKPAGDVYSEQDLKDVPGVGAPKPQPKNNLVPEGQLSTKIALLRSCTRCAQTTRCHRLETTHGSRLRYPLKHAINGIGAMPPRTCADCSDEEMAKLLNI